MKVYELYNYTRYKCGRKCIVAMVDDDGPQFNYFDQQVGPVILMKIFIYSKMHFSIFGSPSRAMFTRKIPFGSIPILK